MRMIMLASAAVLAGCAVGPDFTRPNAPPAAGYTPEPLATSTNPADEKDGGRQRFAVGRDIPGQWWTLFRSPSLNALIERSLLANPVLEAAQAAVQQAVETRRAQQGAFFPNIQGGFTAQRNKTALGALSAVTSNGSGYYNLYTAQVTVGYSPDVFGLNRRAVESLDATAENQRFQLEAAYLTLTSNVVAAAVQEALIRAQVDATRQIIDVVSKSVNLLRKQFELGQVAQADVLVQEALLTTAQATLPPLEKQLAQQRNLLAALTGQLPSNQPTETFDLASLQLPEELPVSLPSRLVEQRPDIRAAEETWRAANAQIGAAVANRLPLFNMAALIGSSPTQIAGLFVPGNGFFTLTAGVTQPIFEGFTLLRRQRAAEAAARQAEAQYRQAVITGFQNVADTLRVLQSDADASRTALAAERTAQASLDIARRQLALGQINNLVLLTAQQTSLQARLNLVQAQANRFADTAALFQAFGGGWWNRPEQQAVLSGSRP